MSRYECPRCGRLVGRIIVVNGIEQREKGEAWEPFAVCQSCWSQMQPPRAERRIGELLKETEKAKGAPGPGRGKAGTKSGPAFTDAPKLSDLGVTKNESSRTKAQLSFFGGAS